MSGLFRSPRGFFAPSPAVLLLLLAAFCLPPQAMAADIPSSAAYRPIVGNLILGHANDAIAQLRTELAQDSRDAEAHNLLCRVYFQERRWKDAIGECQQAVQLQPANSNYHLWLGRADGEMAEHTNLFAAYALARKVHAEFQTAVRLNPKNFAALSDLGEYSVEAPGFLGGGLDQARHTAELLAPLDAARSHNLLAQIAWKRKDSATAEHELQQAVRTSAHPAQAWMDLASFYARERNYPAMQQAIQNGMASNPLDGQALAHGASILIHSRQGDVQAQATAMLKQYLSSAQRSEDAPAFQVHVQLGKLLARQGDHTGARREFSRANELAGDFAPARKLPEPS